MPKINITEKDIESIKTVLEFIDSYIAVGSMLSFMITPHTERLKMLVKKYQDQKG